MSTVNDPFSIARILDPCNGCGEHTARRGDTLCRRCRYEAVVLEAEIIVDIAAMHFEALAAVCDNCLPHLRSVGIHDNHWWMTTDELRSRGLE